MIDEKWGAGAAARRPATHTGATGLLMEIFPGDYGAASGCGGGWLLSRCPRSSLVCPIAIAALST